MSAPSEVNPTTEARAESQPRGLFESVREALAADAPADNPIDSAPLQGPLGRALQARGVLSVPRSMGLAEAQKAARSGSWLIGIDGDPSRALVLGPAGSDGAPDGVAASLHRGNGHETVDPSTARLADLLTVGADEVGHWLEVPSSAATEPMNPAALPPSATPFQRLRTLVRPDRGDLIAVLAFAVTTGVLLLATPVAVQALVTSIALGGLLQPLVVVSILLMVALGLAGSLIAVQTWVVELLQRRIFVRTVAQLASRLPRVSLDAYDEGHGPELVNRFFDVVTIQKAASKLLIDTLGMALSVIVGLTILAFYHPILLAVATLLIVAIAVLVLGPLGRGQRTAIDESSAKYALAAWFEDIARSPLAFKSGGAGALVFDRTDRLAHDWIDARSSHFRGFFSQVIGALTLQVVGSSALLGIGGLLVIRDSLSLGQLVAAELIVSAVLLSVAKLGKHLETWYDLMAAVAKVGVLLDVPLESEEGERPESAPGGAALRVIDQDAGTVHLEVRPGESVALIHRGGDSATGFVEALWRMRSPDGTRILIDGRAIGDLALEHLRTEVAVVSSPEILHGTVLENVSLSRPFVTADHVRFALAIVGLTDRIAALPDGLQTRIGPYDRGLSAVEERLLMLARAVAGRPRLLAVDSLVDSLPSADRIALLERLSDPANGWTLVVVSIDEHVLERCDHVHAVGEPTPMVSHP